MKLFKMLGQVFEENPSTIVMKEKKLSDLVNDYNQQFIRSQEEAKKVIQQEKAAVQTPATGSANSQPSYSSKNKYQTNPQGNSSTLYVLFAPSGDTLSVLRNGNKEDIKLYGISHIDKNTPKAKQACKYINDLVLKKKVFFEQININNNIEYKIFLDKEKTASLNELLIQNNLSFSGKAKEDNLIEQKPSSQNSSYEQKTVDKTKKEIKGLFVKSLKAPYLFDETNKSSYVVVLENNSKEESYWGVDLQRVILEKEIQKGDYVSLENIGPELVSVDVPIKENGKVVRYEHRQVKRNTWNAEILEKAAIKPKVDNIEPSPKKTSTIKPEISNCYALFSINANSFVCMHNNKKEEYQLKGIDEANISVVKNKQIKKHLNELISKRVVYVKINDMEEGIVTLYLNKDDKISVNDTLIDHYKLNEPQIENTTAAVKQNIQPTPVVEKAKNLIAESPVYDNIPQEDNLADYGYGESNIPDFDSNFVSANDIAPPEDFFAGFDIPSDNYTEETPINNIGNDISLPEKESNDFFAGFELDDSGNKNNIVQDNIPSHEVITNNYDNEMPDNFFNGLDIPTDSYVEQTPINNIVKEAKNNVLPVNDPDDFFAGFDLDDSNNKNDTVQVSKSGKGVESTVLGTAEPLVITGNDSNVSSTEESEPPVKKKLAFGRKK